MAKHPESLSRSYHCYHQMSFLYCALQDMYHKEEFCDVIITVGSSTINAHRVVLAAFSPYFHSIILTESLIDQLPQTKINLNDMNEEAVKTVIDFCYTSGVTVTSESVKELLLVSQILEIGEITKLCNKFLDEEKKLNREVITNEIKRQKTAERKTRKEKTSTSDQEPPHSESIQGTLCEDDLEIDCTDLDTKCTDDEEAYDTSDQETQFGDDLEMDCTDDTENHCLKDEDVQDTDNARSCKSAVSRGSRFATVNDKDCEDMRKSLEEITANTKKATGSSTKLLRNYLKEKGLPTDFETYEKAELDRILAKFYVEVRQENGDIYKTASLKSFRHGINRHLLAVSSYDIVKGTDFRKSRKMFNAVCKDLKRRGKGLTYHYPVIGKTDLQKMNDYFDINDSTKVVEKLFVDVMLHFGCRGRANIRHLKITDFALSTDEEGKRYVHMLRDVNHRNYNNTAESRMYEKPGDEKCPVENYLTYKRKRDPRCTALFLRPCKYQDGVKWYENTPLGHNTLGNMMPNISEKAGLSHRYTNHSLRATAIHISEPSQPPIRHVMSESSLKTYRNYKSIKCKPPSSTINFAVPVFRRIEQPSGAAGMVIPLQVASGMQTANIISTVATAPIVTNQTFPLCNNICITPSQTSSNIPMIKSGPFLNKMASLHNPVPTYTIKTDVDANKKVMTMSGFATDTFVGNAVKRDTLTIPANGQSPVIIKQEPTDNV